MGALGDLVFDRRHPASLARFWAAEDDPSVLVEPLVGTGPRLFFTRVPEPKTVKNRVHLGLRAPDVAAEVERLAGLGARVLAKVDDRVLLADPEGGELCVLPAT